MENIKAFTELITKKGIAKSNRFRIEILLSGNLSKLSPSGDGGRDISLLCESIKFPTRIINTFEFSSWRNSIKIPNGYINEDVTAVFHLTNDYYIKTIFDKWLNAIVNVDNYLISYDDQFKTTIRIFQLDEKDRDIYGVELREAYPIQMGSIDLDNTSENSTQKLTIEFTYNNWIPIGENSLTTFTDNLNVGDDASLDSNLNQLNSINRAFNV